MHLTHQELPTLCQGLPYRVHRIPPNVLELVTQLNRDPAQCWNNVGYRGSKREVVEHLLLSRGLRPEEVLSLTRRVATVLVDGGLLWEVRHGGGWLKECNKKKGFTHWALDLLELWGRPSLIIRLGHVLEPFGGEVEVG